MYRRLPSAAAALALTMLGAISVSQPALADTPAPGQLQVQITSPAQGNNVTGTVPVTLHITGDGTVTPTSATVTMASATTPGESRAASVTGLDPSCATSCDVVVNVDTMSWQDPGDDSQAVPTMLSNGQASVDATVTADSASGTLTAAAPQLTVYATGRSDLAKDFWQSTLLAYPSTVTARFVLGQPAAAPDHLVMTIFGNGYHRDVTVAPLNPSATSYVQYEVPIDMTGQPDGMYWLRAASIDVTGRASTVVLVPLSVFSGPAVKEVTSLVPVDPATHNGFGARLNIKVNQEPDANEPGPGPGPAPGAFEVSLDGTAAQKPKFTYDPATGTTSMLLYAPGGAAATGAHTLSIAYYLVIDTDMYGNILRSATGNWAGQVSTAGIAVSATTTSPAFEGYSGSLSVTMTGVSDSTGLLPKVAAWRVADQWNGTGSVLGSGTCSVNCESMTVTVPLSKLIGGYPGLSDGSRDHSLQVLVTDDTGLARPFVVHVIVAAKARVSLLVPASAAYGTTVHILTGVQQTNNEMLPGVPVVFQAMTGGSNLWRTVATGTTNSQGLVSAPIFMAYNTQWRAVVAQRAGYNSAGQSPVTSTAVPARVVVTGIPSSGYAYHVYSMATTVLPHSTGRLVYVQARKYGTTTWVTIVKPTTDAAGVARNTVKFTRGTWYIRAVASGTLSSGTGYSNTVTTVIH